MYLGVDWYPDQWGMDQVEEDLDGIVGLGANIVRIADFAWHIFEPYDGHYDFSFFDEVIRRIKERGLKILFCIPTATMPPWLEKKYPQISIMDEQGHRLPYGARRAYCVNSSIYRKKAADLTRELIIHYKDEEAIVAWQVDNEIGHENSDICFCEECHSKFTNYLKRKYPSIDDLNKRWGTDFWSHHYDSFREIPIPKKALVAQNPSLRLEWERFRSLSIKSFLDLEKDVIKAVKPDALVLHDFSGGTMDKHYDPFDAAKDLDAIAYNNYPVWGGMPEALPNYATAFNLDHARGMKRKNFWITEEIMGAQGHDVIGAAPKPDQGIVWALQAMAHGCENLLFFRYRGFTKGAEQYCFGILDSDNRKKRKYEEVKRFFAEAKKYEDAFTSPIHNDVVLLYDYDSAASFRHQQQSSQFGFTAEMQKLYEELWKRGIGTDICASDIDFSGYRLVVLPHMIVMDESFKEK
ncbi:MAG: beta-galactosidase, partial [Erysipelotrichaceae bacterium]|nr:beta-galactosidase [Erysipelotrichaceae bacterium]